MTSASLVAAKLLQAGAVTLRPEQPFKWASGWNSPIYCDNRRLLALPFVRDYIKSELCNLVFEQFPTAEGIAGVATAGIPWGALVADQLKLPFIYVRPQPKDHGRQNQIEGSYSPDQQVVVIEDLISTGKSSLQVVEVLRSAGVAVQGVSAIFQYGFPVSSDAFTHADVVLHTLTDYTNLLQTAVSTGILDEAAQELLLKWREDPSRWKGVA